MDCPKYFLPLYMLFSRLQGIMVNQRLPFDKLRKKDGPTQQEAFHVGFKIPHESW